MLSIKSGLDELKIIKNKLIDKNITYNEIACVRAHIKMKERINKSL